MSKVASTKTGIIHKFTKLSVIVPALTVAVAFTACVAVGIGGYMNARSGLEKAANSELAMIAGAREGLLDLRMNSLSGDLATTSSGAAANLAFTDLNSSLGSLDKDREALDSYFRPEGADASARAELTGKDSKTMYAWRHTDMHNSFYSSWKNNHYADIFAINTDGLVIYSVTKSADFLDNANSDTLKGTGLGEVFAKAIVAEKGAQFQSSFEAYAPAGGEPSMFIAAPAYVTSFSGEELGGVIVVRINSAFLESVTNDRKGLGETGQAYIVDDAGRMITNQPLASEPTALNKMASGAAVQGALAGAFTQGSVTGADGIDRLTSAVPMKVGDRTWAVVAERSVNEAMASVTEMRDAMIITTLITVAIAAVIALVFSRSITVPLAGLVNALEAIASGTRTTEIKSAKRRDEIGDIGRAVLKIRQNAEEEQEQRAEEEALAARSSAEQRQKMLASLAGDFEATVGQVVENVARSAASLRESAGEMRQMMEDSGETSSRAAKVSAEAMTEVQSIASASDQLSSSIEEISSLIERSASVAKTATIRAESTNETVKSLAEAANRIGEVITLISDIADQTNLLALNATIEAARAGEAGRGFAVVASEVKELASQTGKATEEIQLQISAIRNATDEAVGAIGDIQQTIGEISQSVTDVSAAVTEQSYATRGIAENTQRAAVGTSNVSEDISNVSQISAQTREAANSFSISVEDLTEQTNNLDQQVRTFLGQVRSA
ncbi:methyl-accepting chemotaxis protein [Roseibium limicola]|uniref:HAMP domain-containing protein n=1 Tax=Roseibium limicola TaxID=2816037 RepID=A0A939EMZ3_9HYPH|nr:methyl-accepting chemotaxis protein [Roseibium limicola]MBO0344806.1 HAMP domain-containing protein [Roseibium limicola]